jgi:hypothetical protein
VTPDGVFSAVRPGSVIVSAVISGVSGSASISVVPASVESLAVQPTSVTLTAGERTTLAAQPRARSGATIDAHVTWLSSAPGVATVSSGGEVQAVRAGSARITASTGGVSNTVDVTVTAPVVDTRTAIEEVVAAYARALESGDMNALRRAYPGMTPEQERQFSQSLASIERANLRTLSVQEQGDAATANVQGTYEFLTNGRRTTSDPFTFRATFERVDGVWRMMRTQ